MCCVNFPVSSLTKSSNDPRELYLGLLYPTEDYKVYPFLLKDPDIKQLYTHTRTEGFIEDSEQEHVKAYSTWARYIKCSNSICSL